MLLFDRNDRFITPVPSFVTGTGTGIANINHPTSVTAFPNSMDFVLVQASDGIAARCGLLTGGFEAICAVNENDAFGYLMAKVDWGSFKRYEYITRTSLGERTGEVFVNAALQLVNESPRPGAAAR